MSLGMALSLNVLFSMENIQFQLAQNPEVKNSGYSHVTDFSIGFLKANVLCSTARWAGVEDKCLKWAVWWDQDKNIHQYASYWQRQDCRAETRNTPAPIREGAVNL